MESDVGCGVLQKQNPGIATVVKRKYAVGGVSFSEGFGASVCCGLDAP